MSWQRDPLNDVQLAPNLPLSSQQRRESSVNAVHAARKCHGFHSRCATTCPQPPIRYAVYHLASARGLAAFSAAWLGWDAETGREPAPPDLPPLPLPRDQIIAEPQRYGFHATVKAPFRLAPGTDVDTLDAALASLAATLAPVTLSGLSLTRIGHFLALTPDAPSPPLQDLAARCVKALDGFRAPLTPEDIARRRPERLTANQRALLDRWGYPYVMEEFRFHMTLTGRVPAERREAVERVLLDHFADFHGRPLPIAGLALFREQSRGADFTVHSLFPLGGAANRKTA